MLITVGPNMEHLGYPFSCPFFWWIFHRYVSYNYGKSQFLLGESTINDHFPWFAIENCHLQSINIQKAIEHGHRNSTIDGLW